jgi:hypothetical protein
VARGVKIKLKDLEENESPQSQPFNTVNLTTYEVGVQGEKSIVVPSFGTTS